MRIEKRDEDFFDHYSVGQPFKYNVFICPNCGYAGFEDKFLKRTPNQLELIRRRIENRWTKRDYGGERSLEDGILIFKLALYQEEIAGERSVDLGYTCQNISWAYRLLENQEEERRFIKLARDKYISAYEEDDIEGKMSELKLVYLIGELSRRIEDKSEAIRWFGIGMNMEELRSNQLIEDLLREQWRLSKDL